MVADRGRTGDPTVTWKETQTHSPSSAAPDRQMGPDKGTASSTDTGVPTPTRPRYHLKTTSEWSITSGTDS